MRGRDLLERLSLKTDEFIEKSMDARKSLGPEKVKAIAASLKKNDTTTSAEAREAEITKLTKALKRQRNILTGQRKAGIDLPAGIGGELYLRYIAKTHMGKQTADLWLQEELKVRGVTFTNKRWNKLEWNDKKYQLKKHEASLKVDKGQGKEGIDTSKINAIKPQSDVFKALLPRQDEIRRREKNLDCIEQNYT